MTNCVNFCVSEETNCFFICLSLMWYGISETYFLIPTSGDVGEFYREKKKVSRVHCRYKTRGCYHNSVWFCGALQVFYLCRSFILTPKFHSLTLHVDLFKNEPEVACVDFVVALLVFLNRKVKDALHFQYLWGCIRKAIFWRIYTQIPGVNFHLFECQLELCHSCQLPVFSFSAVFCFIPEFFILVS